MAGPRGIDITSPISSATGWTPTVANLVVLVVLEIAAYCLLRYAFRTVHGG